MCVPNRPVQIFDGFQYLRFYEWQHFIRLWQLWYYSAKLPEGTMLGYLKWFGSILWRRRARRGEDWSRSKVPVGCCLHRRPDAGCREVQPLEEGAERGRERPRGGGNPDTVATLTVGLQLSAKTSSRRMHQASGSEWLRFIQGQCLTVSDKRHQRPCSLQLAFAERARARGCLESEDSLSLWLLKSIAVGKKATEKLSAPCILRLRFDG